MDLTYLGNGVLASLARALYVARTRPCAVSPYVFMTDPKRTPHILRHAARLPKGSAIIYRHFGAHDKLAVAIALRQICFVRGVQFLIAQDEGLARETGADGLHLPEKYLGAGPQLRARYPDWIISGSVHSHETLQITKALDAAILSPVFSSISASAGTPLGIEKFTNIVTSAPLPVFALGGINDITAPKLIASGAAGIAGVSGFAK